jgi:hypothetical protein
MRRLVEKSYVQKNIATWITVEPNTILDSLYFSGMQPSISSLGAEITVVFMNLFISGKSSLSSDGASSMMSSAKLERMPMLLRVGELIR